MNAMARFRAGQAAGAAPGGRTAAAAAPRRGRFAGTKAADNRYPLPQVGSYRAVILETRQTTNPKTGEWYHVDFEIVDSNNPAHPVGSKVSYLQGFSGKSMTVGMPKIKRFVMAAVGTEDEGAYDAMDPNGDLIDCTTGVAIEGFPQNPLAGRLVDFDVAEAKRTQDGSDFFRDFSFYVVPEEEQTVRLDAAGAEAPAAQ